MNQPVPKHAQNRRERIFNLVSWALLIFLASLMLASIIVAARMGYYTAAWQWYTQVR